MCILSRYVFDIVGAIVQKDPKANLKLNSFGLIQLQFHELPQLALLLSSDEYTVQVQPPYKTNHVTWCDYTIRIITPRDMISFTLLWTKDIGTLKVSATNINISRLSVSISIILNLFVVIHVGPKRFSRISKIMMHQKRNVPLLSFEFVCW